MMRVGLIVYFSLNRPILKVCQFTVVHWSSTWNTSLANLNRWIYSNLHFLSHQCSCDYCILLLLSIDLSVSPSPRMQTSQWQLSISCTGSGTRTSLGFSAIEKHWKIRSSHQFYGGYASKIERLCAWGLVTLITGILRGWLISFILLHFLNPNKTEQNVSKYSTPIQMKTKTFIFWLSYTH